MNLKIKPMLDNDSKNYCSETNEETTSQERKTAVSALEEKYFLVVNHKSIRDVLKILMA